MTGRIPLPPPHASPAHGPTDPGWSDFLLSLLIGDEKDEAGNPRIHGLRRLVELIIGPVVRLTTHTVQAPNRDNGFHACVEVEVEFAVLQGGDPEGAGCDRSKKDHRIYSDVADVYAGNTDPEFARFAAATAATRAEGRAYRKALRLRRIAAEEATTVPMIDAGLDGFIVENQLRTIDKFCRRLDVDAVALINSGQNQYPDVAQIPEPTARLILERLNVYFNAPARIPTPLKGYKPAWRDS